LEFVAFLIKVITLDVEIEQQKNVTNKPDDNKNLKAWSRNSINQHVIVKLQQAVTIRH